jgi:hypothetical protein
LREKRAIGKGSFRGRQTERPGKSRKKKDGKYRTKADVADRQTEYTAAEGEGDIQTNKRPCPRQRKRKDKTSQHKKRQENTRLDNKRQDKTRQRKTRQAKTRQGQDKTRRDKTRQDKTRQDKTGQGKTT